MKNSIVIVDDHILIAKAIASILSNFTQFEVLYECENGKELQEKCKIPGNVPNIVLLDISMPIMDGFETAKWLKMNHPEVLIMALSMQDDDQSLIKMIKCGAKGYLLKNVHPAELENALNNLIRAGFYYPDWATAKVFESLSNELVKNPLNDREIEFLRHCVTEMSYKEIAEKMCCSTRTVEYYRNTLFERFGLKSRVGLAVYAIKNGFDD
ncbi:response regulator transcription factor [Pedobacter sp. Du54]|uniref:response regulator transcription factor n=1 Tax=Pedobacter anseongensis TaxID=3133439 RepID=UPI0030ACD555